MKLILLLAAAIILLRCIYIVSKLSHRNWLDHRLQFAFLSASYSVLAGGAVGTVIGWHLGPVLLMLSIAGTTLFERRKRS